MTPLVNRPGQEKSPTANACIQKLDIYDYFCLKMTFIICQRDLYKLTICTDLSSTKHHMACKMQQHVGPHILNAELFIEEGVGHSLGMSLQCRGSGICI